MYTVVASQAFFAWRGNLPFMHVDFAALICFAKKTRRNVRDLMQVLGVSVVLIVLFISCAMMLYTSCNMIRQRILNLPVLSSARFIYDYP
jgi:hypothetical protein